MARFCAITILVDLEHYSGLKTLWITTTSIILGPEPLSDEFNAAYLYEKSRGKKAPIKTFIMDGKVVVGVGNIYANESLFLAGIKPTTPTGKISKARMERLVSHIKQVLAAAIEQGGTTLKDFVGGDGKPGYFAQQLNVYGRGGEECVTCKKTLKEIRQGQRTTVYCPVLPEIACYKYLLTLRDNLLKILV